MRELIQRRISESMDVKKAILADDGLHSDIERITEQLLEVINAGNTIFFCGNGGSAADAQHLATELSGRYLLDRPAIKAEALGTNVAFLTAVGNDFDFETTYARSLEALGRKGDAVVLISTSGSSPNIINTAKKAKEMEISTYCLTGSKGQQLSSLCDGSIVIPSDEVPRIQEGYMLVGHIICESLEQSKFSS